MFSNKLVKLLHLVG